MSPSKGFTLLELLAVIVMIAIAAAIVLPLQRSCERPCGRTACASNLNQIAKAMYMYADVPANGCFPTMATGGYPYADTAPMAAWNLLYKSYIQDPRVFSCDKKPIPPSELAKITPTANNGRVPAGATTLTRWRCSYGYDPGHSPNDIVTAIAGDKKGAGPNSDNHGPNAGGNVLIGAGTVEFRDSPVNLMGHDAAGAQLKDDDIFALNATIPRDLDGYIRQ